MQYEKFLNNYSMNNLLSFELKMCSNLPCVNANCELIGIFCVLGLSSAKVLSSSANCITMAIIIGNIIDAEATFEIHRDKNPVILITPNNNLKQLKTISIILIHVITILIHI